MTKEDLKAYTQLRLERDRLAKMLGELTEIIYGPKGQRLDGMPRGGSEPGRPTEEAALKRAELHERYNQKVAEISAALVEIEKAIEVLEPRERTLIRLHYIQGLTWEEVCVAMTYSWRQVHRIHGAALKKLQNKEKEENTPCA